MVKISVLTMKRLLIRASTSECTNEDSDEESDTPKRPRVDFWIKLSKMVK